MPETTTTYEIGPSSQRSFARSVRRTQRQGFGVGISRVVRGPHVHLVHVNGSEDGIRSLHEDLTAHRVLG